MLTKEEKDVFKKMFKVFTEVDEETIEYIFKNPERFFDEETVSDIGYEIGYKLSDVAAAAEYEMAIKEKKTKYDVHFDKRRKMLVFNDFEVPAYWYSPGMKKKEIDEYIDIYFDLFIDNNFSPFKYPLLEDWHPLEEWKEHYKDETILKKMEKDLERDDTEDAHDLKDLFYRRTDIHAIERNYPSKVKEVENVSNFRIEPFKYGKDTGWETEEIHGDVELVLTSGEKIKVDVHYDVKGHSHGMTSIDKKGFPYMTDKDEEKIKDAFWTALIGKEKYQEKKREGVEALKEEVDWEKIRKI